MENRLKHLEMIQGIITRMASNSFVLKGWAVTLVVGIVALAGKDTDKAYFFIIYLPIIVFWGLDSYYLLKERQFRGLYNKVRELPTGNIDFSMKILPKELNNGKNTFCCCFLSKTELLFYLPLALISTAIIVITHL